LSARDLSKKQKRRRFWRLYVVLYDFYYTHIHGFVKTRNDLGSKSQIALQSRPYKNLSHQIQAAGIRETGSAVKAAASPPAAGRPPHSIISQPNEEGRVPDPVGINSARPYTKTSCGTKLSEQARHSQE
jgi:hypothetical protein